ncbi:MAG: hypothetical protein ACJ8EB_01975 [Allosphingosinicella sp.]
MESKTATAIGAGILTVITPLVFPAISLPLGLAFYGVAAGLFAYSGREVIRKRAGRFGASVINHSDPAVSPAPPFPSGMRHPAVEITYYFAGKLVAQPISAKTLRILRFIAENDTPEFYLDAAVKAVPHAKSYMDLKGAWAGLTRRTRKLLGDPEALLIHWSEAYDAEGNWVDWVGAVSKMTHASLRKQFGLAPAAEASLPLTPAARPPI